jgi:hypothetical protein
MKDVRGWLASGLSGRFGSRSSLGLERFSNHAEDRFGLKALVLSRYLFLDEHVGLFERGAQAQDLFLEIFNSLLSHLTAPLLPLRQPTSAPRSGGAR